MSTVLKLTESKTKKELTISDQPPITLSYRDAGVDIDAGNALVERIKHVTAKTRRPEVMGNIGGFGALCKLPTNYRKPVLVSGTDGVGTKLKIAIDHNRHDTIGIDLVAMCVNDLLAIGAEPLFFLDYYATAKLDVDVATSVISGIANGCEMAGAALIGGETAEMPGMYQTGDYDLAGFCVGVVEEDEAIDGTKVAVGDALIALPSSGPHSNGYSLIRKVIEHANADLSQTMGQHTLLDALIAPTEIYVKPVLSLLKSIPMHAIAHITGGGLTENIPRVLPDHCAASIELDSWQLPAVFQWLQQQGNIQEQEMLRTFNCGAGLVIAVNSNDADKVISEFNAQDISAWLIGSVIEKTNEDAVVYSGSLR